ncbi:MAG: redoxin domain-containing protein [Candidatus Omnitrophica bacterium]|nr:redoxin domain-containing protein [Candidatus Omnitrophota bacterium]
MQIRKLCVSAVIVVGVWTGYAAAAEEISPAMLVKEIQARYETVRNFSATIRQTNSMSGMEITVSGPVRQKYPDKFRAELAVSGLPDGQTVHSLSVYDGATFWQEQRTPEGKSVRAMKVLTAPDSEQGKMLLAQFSPAAQFRGVLETYAPVQVEESQSDGYRVQIVRLQMTEAARKKIEQRLQAEGNPAGAETIPEKMSYYWNTAGAYCEKIEVYNAQQRRLSQVVYTEVAQNKELPDELFSYTPPEGVEVMDMSAAVGAPDAGESPQGAEHPLVGKPCPDFTLLDARGQLFKRAQIKNKIAVIDFWASWCPPCQKELPLLDQWYQEWKTDAQVQFLAVSAEEKDVVAEFIAQNGYQLPVFFDGGAAFARQLGVESIPQVVVVGRDGVIAAVYVGLHPDIGERLTADIQRLKR